MELSFQWVREEQPGARWLELFERSWPSYSDWFLSEGDESRPDLATCRRKLGEFMPEFLPLWERLVDLSRGGELAARLLSCYRPAPYLVGCSQAVWARGAPMLVRNYDYHPTACEATFLMTSWSGTRVLASSDCLWGALDGMNEHGLVAALSFGGRFEVGDGFGIPLILRYVLERCRTVGEAAGVLRRIPSHMAYNVSLLDASGDFSVASIGPDRRTTIRRRAIATNHQRGGQRSEDIRSASSSERERFLEQRMEDKSLTAEEFQKLFLEPPLYSRRYERGFGTLYTAVYHPRELSAEFLWPRVRHRQSFGDFREGGITIQLVP